MGDPPSPRVGFKPFAYDDSVPSVRLRTLLPVAELRRGGIDAGLVDPARLDTYDCVVFQKAYDDASVAQAERLADRNVPMVLDLCDNHLFDGGDPELAARAARIRRMIEIVDLVSVSTPALADLVTAAPTCVVDDALETPHERTVTRLGVNLRRSVRRGTRRRVRLVWFGHHGTEHPPSGMVHLGHIVPELTELNRSVPVQLTVISNSRRRFDEWIAPAPFPTRFVEWKARTFARRFRAHDVCVIPIEANPVTIYKTNNRVRTSLVLGVPVVTSEIPSYREFAPWMLFDDWARNIEVYARDRDLVARHLAGAREHIRRTYTPDHLRDQWMGVLRRVLG